MKRTVTALLISSVVLFGVAGIAQAQEGRPADPNSRKPATNTPAVNAPAANAAANNAAANNAADPNDPNAKAPVDDGGPMQKYGIWIVLLGMLVLFWWITNRNKKKQEQQRRDMLSNLKKGDKVTSIGGIIGTVAEVREDEVLVNVGDSRIKFARWAIRGVGEEGKAEKPEETKKDEDKK